MHFGFFRLKYVLIKESINVAIVSEKIEKIACKDTNIKPFEELRHVTIDLRKIERQEKTKKLDHFECWRSRFEKDI